MLNYYYNSIIITINEYSDQYDYLLQGWLQNKTPHKALAKREARKAAVTAAAPVAKTAKPANK